MLGSEAIDSPKLANPNLLLLPIKENFENILHKTLLSVEWALATKKFDFLVRTNTSTYFEDSKLRTHLLDKKIETTFSGEFGKYHGTHFVAGNFMVISRDNCDLLLQMDHEDWAEYPDDVAISKYLILNGIQPQRIKRNDLTDFSPFRFSIQHRIKSLTDSEVVGRRFQEISDIYNSNWNQRPFRIAKHQSAEFARYLSERPIRNIRSFFGFLRYIYRVLLVMPRNIVSH